MATLYEIKSNYLYALDCMEVNEDGEVLNAELIETLAAEFDEKAENVACYIKNIEADAKALKEEEASLKARREKTERKAERLRKYLKTMLQEVGKTKFSTAKCELSFRKSESVLVEDGTELPEEYVTVKTTTAPNKTELKAALKAGKTIAGVTLEVKQNLQIK